MGSLVADVGRFHDEFGRQLVLDGEVPILDVGQLVGVRAGGLYPGEQTLRRIGVGQGALEVRIRLVQPVRRIVGEAGGAGAGVDRDLAAETAGEAAEAPVIANLRSICQTVARANHHLLVHPVGETNPRSELRPVDVLEPITEYKRARQALSAGIGRIQIHHRHAIGDLAE